MSAAVRTFSSCFSMTPSHRDLVLIVTPMPVEWEAVRRKIGNLATVSGDVPLARGTIGGADVLCALSGKGSGMTGAITMQLIERHSPRYVFLVGVAGGLEGVALGDVVVPTSVADLDYGKVEASEFHRRRENDWIPDHKLLQFATLLGEHESETWKTLIAVRRPDRRLSSAVKAHFGYFGSSGKVVDDPTYPSIEDARKTATELLAVEMEATGFGAAAKAAQSGSKVGMLMIRGISDLVDVSRSGGGTGTKQRGKWKPFAADAAAAFAAALIGELYPQTSNVANDKKPSVDKLNVSANASSYEMSVDEIDGLVRASAVVDTLVARVIETLGVPGALALRPEGYVPSLEPPPPVAKLVRRPETVEALSSALRRHVWTSFVGPAGSGKTLLAILLTDGHRVRWLNRDSFRTEETFEARLGSLGSGPQNAFERASAAIGSGGVIVLDDVPSDGQLASGLAALARAAAKHGVHVLSLSAARLPASVRRALPEGQFVTETVPDFLDAEAAALFELYGSPKLAEKQLRFLNATARGNPTILTAVAEYLRSHGWQLREEIQALLSRAHLAEIEPEVLQRLLTDVKDARTRELFHRIRVLDRKVGADTIERMAALPPPIDRVTERLVELDGLWIRRTSPQEFEIAPLAAALPIRVLDVEIKRACHVVAAETILRRGTLDGDTGALVISHFVAGGEVNRAGAILLSALTTIVLAKAWHESLLLGLWVSEALPNELDLTIRLSIRTQQIKVARETGASLVFLAKDAPQLFAECGQNELAILIFLAFESALKRRGDPLLWEIAMLALERVVPLLPPDGRVRFGEETFAPTTWATTLHLTARLVRTSDQLERWIRLVEALPPQLRPVFETASELGTAAMVNEWWVRAVDEEANADELAALVGRLERLQDWATRRRDENLAVRAAVAQIIVTGEYLHDSSRSVTFGIDALKVFASSRSQFLLNEAVGTQYSVAADFESAEKYFNSALAHLANATSSEHVNLLRRLAQAVGRRDEKQALEFLERALLLARAAHSETFLPIELAQVLGDLGLAAWHSGQRKCAFEAWREATEIAFQHGFDDNVWRGFFVVLHVCVAYAALHARIDQAPVIPETGERMERPLVGVFLRDMSRQATHWKPQSISIVGISLSYLAADIDDRQEAYAWAERAHTEAVAQCDEQRIELIANELFPLLLPTNDMHRAMLLLEERISASTDSDSPLTTGGDVWVLHQLLLAVIRACRVALDDAEMARTMLVAIADHCRRVMKDANAADALSTAFNASLKSFSTSSLEMIYGRDDLPEAVRLISRLLHSLDRNVVVTERAIDHLMIVFGVQSRSGYWGPSYKWIVLEFFETYWMRELLSSAFRFRRPGDLRRELLAVSAVPAEVRLALLLVTVADGLDLPLAPEFRSALEQRPVPAS